VGKKKKDITETENILHEDASAYGFANKSELEKLREDVFRSDKEKFILFTRMLRRNATLRKAVINHKSV
jgi:hypothetical protein